MLVRMSLAALVLALSSTAFAQSHSMIDRNRSSLNKNIYLTAAVEGEYGNVEKTIKGSDVIVSDSWRGYGIRNGAGVEVFKFVQFGLSHTLVNMRSGSDGLENLSGSRISADLGFSFSSPISNVQFGLGYLADSLQYQGAQKSATFNGAGQYYSIGLNYFVSTSISIQGVARRLEVNNNKSGGSADIYKLNSKTDNLSLGLAVWL